MSYTKMTRNERRNRRKALWITALVHLGILGTVLAYTQLDDWATYLPEPAKEWLQIEDQPESPETAPAKSKKPRKPRA